MNIDQLIEQTKQRNENCLTELMRHTTPLVRYIIAPILQNQQEQEECLADITMLVWDKIELFDASRGSWNGWITTLSRNTALNRARNNKRFRETEEIPENMASQTATPEEKLLETERRAALNCALQRLSIKDRTLFYRKYYYRQSTAQIAAEFGMTERAVEGKLYRLKKQLRDQLGGESNE